MAFSDHETEQIRRALLAEARRCAVSLKPYVDFLGDAAGGACRTCAARQYAAVAEAFAVV